MFSLGKLFSLCAGILIGIKLYYRYFTRKSKKKASSLNEMSKIIDTNGYGTIFTDQKTRFVELKDGAYFVKDGKLFAMDDKPISEPHRFWTDLWYGSGGK